MSYDIAVLAINSTLSDKDALQLLHSFQEQTETKSTPPSIHIAAFLKELTNKFPTLDNAADIDNCPWSGPFDISENHVLMPIRSEYVRQTLDFIIKCAANSKLLCVDPQSAKTVYNPFKVAKNLWWQFWK